ncbi:VMAP-C domain-containing protein [Merismopedia glauca]|uniref:Uncharacterized protein n=1 Tax=Merismopedia glauca CCAP 1448/3 TaxID=1296344 RepID=A0A2T1C0E1_9CYAN|nr:hypothetical protein [Merismopedia glauca]PSB01637.1 hypothetical protein C7B64_17325 [Merismopedia glauca CCAP 1448/3]
MECDRGVILKLIKEALTQEDFNDLVFADFRAIYEQFTDGQILADRIRKLIDYAEKHRQIPKLLKLINQKNPTVYQELQSQLSLPIIPSLSNLREQLTSDTQLVDELRKIIDQKDESFGQCLKQVYQDFLLDVNDEPELDREINNLDDIVWELEDRTEQSIFLEFLPRLIAYLSIYQPRISQAISNNLQQWTRENMVRFKVDKSEFNNALKQFKQTYKQRSGKVYLIIAIKENRSYPNFWQISGWLTNDEIMINPHRDAISLKNQYSGIDIDNVPAPEKGYTLVETKEIVGNFIKQIAVKIERLEQLVIEFFLPSSLLSWEVDKWELEPLTQIYLESVHEIRIRSLDRLSLKYQLHREKWNKKWIFVQKCRNPIEQFLTSYCHCNINTLVGQLQDEKMLGVKLRSPLNSGHEGIASALYYSGTPLAIWLRRDPLSGDCETEINRLLQDPLLQLPARVFQKRCQSEQHISLIWDNPNRLIPNYQLQ